MEENEKLQKQIESMTIEKANSECAEHDQKIVEMVIKLKEEISMLHNVINEYKKDNEKLQTLMDYNYKLRIEFQETIEKHKIMEWNDFYKLEKEIKKLEKQVKTKDKQITELTLQLH